MPGPAQTALPSVSGASGREIGLSDRTAAIVAAIQAGETGAALGLRFGISRERVRQVYTRATGERIPLRGWRCGLCSARVSEGRREHTASASHQASLLRRAEDRFWAYVAFGDGCWEWTGARDPTGYGRCSITRLERSGYAHRIAYTVVVRPIPPGLTLDHLCRNRGCVRPSHLEAVTHRENILRSPIAQAAINARKTHCLRGHAYAGDNLRLTPRGWRRCRTCNNAKSLEWHRQRRARQSAA